jgi:hypothetical protein
MSKTQGSSLLGVFVPLGKKSTKGRGYSIFTKVNQKILVKGEFQ